MHPCMPQDIQMLSSEEQHFIRQWLEFEDKGLVFVRVAESLGRKAMVIFDRILHEEGPIHKRLVSIRYLMWLKPHDVRQSDLNWIVLWVFLGIHRVSQPLHPEGFVVESFDEVVEPLRSAFRKIGFKREFYFKDGKSHELLFRDNSAVKIPLSVRTMAEADKEQIPESDRTLISRFQMEGEGEFYKVVAGSLSIGVIHIRKELKDVLGVRCCHIANTFVFKDLFDGGLLAAQMQMLVRFFVRAGMQCAAIKQAENLSVTLCFQEYVDPLIFVSALKQEGVERRGRRMVENANGKYEEWVLVKPLFKAPDPVLVQSPSKRARSEGGEASGHLVKAAAVPGAALGKALANQP